jgi:hypothetical protein
MLCTLLHLRSQLNGKKRNTTLSLALTVVLILSSYAIETKEVVDREQCTCLD